MIPRRLGRKIERSLLQFPVVGLIGSRQVGKTTLARQIASRRGDDAVYLDLERASDLAKLRDPELYLARHGARLVVLDEIQRLPSLFPLLRSLVDEAPDEAGRFLVLGSASPELIHDASESLAGRIVYHDLAPLSLSEVPSDDVQLHWLRGGYPRSLLAPSDLESLEWRRAFVRTYLERDVPQLGFRVTAAQLRRFWTMLAHSHGQLWNASKIAASLGVSAPAVRRYLDLLEDTFLVRQLAPYHANVKKRLVKSPKIYLRDSGLLHALTRIEDPEMLLGSPLAGASWEGWVVEQLAAVLPESWPLHFYRTAAGAEIDVVVLQPSGPPVPVEIKLSVSPSLGKGFRLAFEDVGAERGYLVYPGAERYGLSSQVDAVPAADLASLGEEIAGRG